IASLRPTATILSPWMAIASTTLDAASMVMTLPLRRTMSAGAISAIRRGDAEKIRGLETGASDEGAIDVGDVQQFGSIRRLHRAAVENPHATPCRAIALFKISPDRGVHFSNIGGRRC